jgi:4-hydroxy 2-oxovalerate aldolase
MGRALTNTLRAVADGVTWVDSTVTGMGRGPGNARTENLAIEVSEIRETPIDISPLLALISNYFQKMQDKYGWGTNPYYYLAGKYGIHPTYVQAMLSDSRYMSDDIFSVIEHLKEVGGKRFRVDELEIGRNFYRGAPSGSWAPAEMLKDRQVLILGSGPGVVKHRAALTQLVEVRQPLVVALNADLELSDDLVDLRVASHPFRLLSNSDVYLKFPQPLVAPASVLPESVSASLEGKDLLDFGLSVEPNVFDFAEMYCVLPTSLTAFYALALAVSGGAREILMAGFDGYPLGDQRNGEIGHLLESFQEVRVVPPVTAVTPTVYPLSIRSVYSML